MGVSISETHEEKGSKIKTLKAFSQISHALVNFQLSDSSTTHLQLCTFCDVRRAQQEGWDRKLIKSKIFWEIKPASRFKKFEKVFSFFLWVGGSLLSACLFMFDTNLLSDSNSTIILLRAKKCCGLSKKDAFF